MTVSVKLTISIQSECAKYDCVCQVILTTDDKVNKMEPKTNTQKKKYCFLCDRTVMFS